MPRRSLRLQKCSQNPVMQKRDNGIGKTSPTDNVPLSIDKNAKPTSKTQSDTIQNLSNVTLSSAEISVLERGLNFCPTVKAPDAERLLDDIYFFCRKLKLKEHFHDRSGQQSDESESAVETDDERCEVKTKVSNPYYNPSRGPSDALATYISAIKKDVIDLLHRPNREPSNMTPQEREALKSLAKKQQYCYTGSR